VAIIAFDPYVYIYNMHIYLYVAAKNKYDSWDDAPSRAGKNSLMINTIYENSDAPSKIVLLIRLFKHYLWDSAMKQPVAAR
jgi:hypothetical protein